MIKRKDIDKSFNNKKLEDIIEDLLKDKNDKNQEKLSYELLESKFYSLVGLKKEEEKEYINMLQCVSNNKDMLLPVFTSEEELKKANHIEEIDKEEEENPFEIVLLSFNEVGGLILDKGTDFKGFVINPSTSQVIIEDEFIEYIIGREREKDEARFKKGGEISLNPNDDLEIVTMDKDDYPKELINALRKHFKKEGNIKAAYIRVLYHNNMKSYLLITDFTGNKEDTFKKISRAAKFHLKDGFLDQLEYNTTFGKEAAKGIIPFYKKKILGIF